ncbi:MAG: CopD family protein [Pseudomonadota bacterium]
MWAVAIILHLLGTLIWVGGMFFAHMTLRPAAAELLDPPQRLPLLNRVLQGFFRWVWLAVAVILATGFWMNFGPLGGPVRLAVHLMMGIGLLMTGIFIYIWTVPYRGLAAAVRVADWPAAGVRMKVIRSLILTNLILGLIATILGGVSRFI